MFLIAPVFPKSSGQNQVACRGVSCVIDFIVYCILLYIFISLQSSAVAFLKYFNSDGQKSWMISSSNTTSYFFQQS